MIRLSELERDRNRPVAGHLDGVDWERAHDYVEPSAGSVTWNSPTSDSMWAIPSAYARQFNETRLPDMASRRTSIWDWQDTVYRDVVRQAVELTALRGVNVESATDVLTAVRPLTHAQTGQYCPDVHTTMGGLNRLPPCIMCTCGVYIKDSEWEGHVSGEVTAITSFHGQRNVPRQPTYGGSYRVDSRGNRIPFYTVRPTTMIVDDAIDDDRVYIADPSRYSAVPMNRPVPNTASAENLPRIGGDASSWRWWLQQLMAESPRLENTDVPENE